MSEVEHGFRTFKTGHLEVRPIFVRKRERTIAHLFITMLAYKIERFLRSAWRDLDLTVAEGIAELSSIVSCVVVVGGVDIIRVPKANERCDELLSRVNVSLPKSLPSIQKNVATRTTLTSSRKI